MDGTGNTKDGSGKFVYNFNRETRQNQYTDTGVTLVGKIFMAHKYGATGPLQMSIKIRISSALL